MPADRFYDAYFPALTELGNRCEGITDSRAQKWWIDHCVECVSFFECDQSASTTYKKMVKEFGDEFFFYPHVPHLRYLDEKRRVAVNTLFYRHQNGLPIITSDFEYSSGDVQMVIDWLNGLHDDGDTRMLSKLWKLNWKQALEHSQKWHGRLSKNRVKGVAGNEGTGMRFQFPDGLYIVHLDTVEALDREGYVMGNCVGKGSYDHYIEATIVRDGIVLPADILAGIWSLRDANGKSLVTVEIARDETGHYREVQAFGPGNSELPERYYAHIEVIEIKINEIINPNGFKAA